MNFLDAVKMEIVDPPQQASAIGLPFVTHQGTLHFGGFTCQVYQLNTGQRIIDEKAVIAFMRFLESDESLPPRAGPPPSP